MLSHLFSSELSLRLVQALLTLTFTLVVLFWAQKKRINLFQEGLQALLRGLAQVVAIGSVLLLVFRGSIWGSILLLFFMILVASRVTARRIRRVEGSFTIAFLGIALGGGLVTFLMTWMGVIDSHPTSLVPVGSMIIANAMNTCSLALERLLSEVETQRSLIEAGLSLGVPAPKVIAPYLERALTASLIPRIDSLRSLGIVWIPGLMAGMILAGTSPVSSALYQFVVIAMIFSVSILSAFISARFLSVRLFSPAHQLLLLPPEKKPFSE